MIICKEIDDYLAYCKEHPKWINRDRKLLIRNVVKPTLKRKDVFFDETTFRNCIRYLEVNYYPLFPYQKFVLAFVFMYDTTGEPLFPEIVMLMGRGNGKDGFMAPLANFLQTPLYGIPEYHVELVANSEAQIKDTFNVVYNKLDRNPKFKGKFRVTKEVIENLETRSILRYNTSNASTKDGKAPGCIFFNEYHAYENNDSVNVFESSEGKKKHFREIIITTNGYVREGPLDKLLDDCRKILEGGANPLGIFPFLCRLDRESEIGKWDPMHKANPSMEYLPTLERAIARGYERAKNDQDKWREYVTKRCNLPQLREEQAVTSWKNILLCSYKDAKRKTLRKTQDTRGKSAIIGIDYADVRDFASAGILTIDDDGNHIWRQHTWICSESPFLNSIKFPIADAGKAGFKDFEVVRAPVIPVDGIVDWCERQMSDYSVVKITMDTYRYTLFKTIFEQRGIPIETRDNPQGTVRLIRKIGSACGIIAPSVEKLFSEHRVDYGDSAIMRWYTQNTGTLTDKYGSMQYVKIEPKLRKNDGFMAFVAAEFSADLLKETIIYV
ncbi:MAG TPA: terminase [Lachnospiraceae bacterium]|nr:terminase [Lachnospiraceae bacterium]